MSALKLSALIATAVLALPASAQDQAKPEAPASSKPNAADEVVCEKQKVIGSRLGSKRICKTRSQWATERLQDRQEIDKIQIQRGTKSE